MTAHLEGINGELKNRKIHWDIGPEAVYIHLNTNFGYEEY